MPVGLELYLNYSVIFDDFHHVVNDQTNRWTTIIDTGCTATILADTENGILQLISDSGDNEGASIQKNETIKFNSGKKLFFECRCSISDADDCDIAIGLAENHATNPEAMILGAGVWFQVNEADASGNILCKAGTAGASSESSGVAFADGVARRLGFVYDGSNTVTFYVDRAAVASMNFASMPTALITPSAYFIEGAAGTDSMNIDYIFVASER